jgi:hypothetical protein
MGKIGVYVENASQAWDFVRLSTHIKAQAPNQEQGNKPAVWLGSQAAPNISPGKHAITSTPAIK